MHGGATGSGAPAGNQIALKSSLYTAAGSGLQRRIDISPDLYNYLILLHILSP